LHGCNLWLALDRRHTGPSRRLGWWGRAATGCGRVPHSVPRRQPPRGIAPARIFTGHRSPTPGRRALPLLWSPCVLP
jgi:hypothetical protein